MRIVGPIGASAAPARTLGFSGLILLVISIAAVPAPHAQEVKFGVVSDLGEAETRAECEPLMTYLSTAVGRAVTLHIAKDEGALGAQLEAGAVDIGRLSPFAYVAAARGGRVRLIAQPELDGSATYRSLIITRFDSGIQTLGDLKGKRFAFADARSAAGFVFPRAMLVEKGIDPERDFKETLFAGSHEKVIAAVLLGPAHAGAVSDPAVGAATATGLPTFDIVVLATSDPIPHGAIVVRTDLDEALTIGLRRALVGLETSPAGRQAIGRSGKEPSGYAPADDSLYAGVRRMETSVGTSRPSPGSTK